MWNLPQAEQILGTQPIQALRMILLATVDVRLALLRKYPFFVRFLMQAIQQSKRTDVTEMLLKCVADLFLVAEVADCRKFVASVPFLPILQLTLATQDPGVLEATIRLISYLYEYGDRWVVPAEWFVSFLLFSIDRFICRAILSRFPYFTSVQPTCQTLFRPPSFFTPTPSLNPSNSVVQSALDASRIFDVFPAATLQSTTQLVAMQHLATHLLAQVGCFRASQDESGRVGLGVLVLVRALRAYVLGAELHI